MSALENPFQPGAGTEPPFLAGRDEVLDAFSHRLEFLREGKAGGRGVILMQGPRGNGKTVLLTRFRKMARAAGGREESGPVVFKYTPTADDDSPKVMDALRPLLDEARTEGVVPDEVVERTTGGNLGIAGYAGVQGALRTRPGKTGNAELATMLVAASKRRPLVLLVSEAQALPLNLHRALLNIAQDACTAGARLLVVLTGTPGLALHVRKAATFAERLSVIDVDLLKPEDAAEAIRRPLNDRSVDIPDDLLSEVVEDSECYPYFLQEWGAALWREVHRESAPAAGKPRVVEREAVKRAGEFVAAHRREFYDLRHADLTKLGLGWPAAVVARAFEASKEPLDISAVRKHVIEALKEHVTDARRRTLEARAFLDGLVAEGFIWEPRGQGNIYAPGIPSLMDYTLSMDRDEAEAIYAPPGSAPLVGSVSDLVVRGYGRLNKPTGRIQKMPTRGRKAAETVP